TGATIEIASQAPDLHRHASPLVAFDVRHPYHNRPIVPAVRAVKPPSRNIRRVLPAWDIRPLDVVATHRAQPLNRGSLHQSPPFSMCSRSIVAHCTASARASNRRAVRNSPSIQNMASTPKPP